MLNVRPPRFRNGRHVEAVPLRDEGNFVRRELVRQAIAFKVLIDAIAAHRSLDGSDTGRRGDIEESIGHSGRSFRVTEVGWTEEGRQPSLTSGTLVLRARELRNRTPRRV